MRHTQTVTVACNAKNLTRASNLKSASKLAALSLVGVLSAPSALAGATYAEADVLAVEPIIETVTHIVPRQECRDETVAYRDAPRRRSATGPILGAVIGGAIGHAVGHRKRNKQVGAAVGAVLGGSIGADIARANRRHDGEVTYRTEQVCQTIRDVREEERISGYNVTYAYAGQTFETRMSRDPGDTLPVRVDVTPRF